VTNKINCTNCADINLALHKPASQVSTYQSDVAARAVDGDRGSLSCTLPLRHPWWSVDLGAQYNVGRVTVMNYDHTLLGIYDFERV